MYWGLPVGPRLGVALQVRLLADTYVSFFEVPCYMELQGYQYQNIENKCGHTYYMLNFRFCDYFRVTCKTPCFLNTPREKIPSTS